MAERRNRELHTAVFAYEDFKSGQWLHDFYRVAKLLNEYMGRDVSDFLGKVRGAEANDAAKEAKDKAKGSVEKKLAAARDRVAALRPAELTERRKDVLLAMGWFSEASRTVHTVQCPVCESRARLIVQHVTDRPAEIDGDSVYQSSVYSPRAFECRVCDLEISGTAELRIADLADQVVRTWESSAVEYFEIDVATDDGDYGND